MQKTENPNGIRLDNDERSKQAGKDRGEANDDGWP